jgi:hypothetical protein
MGRPRHAMRASGRTSWVGQATGAIFLAACATGLAEEGADSSAANGAACAVSGGSRSNPADLGAVLATSTDCTTFVLSNGYYAPTSITRSGITVRAANRCGARLEPELEIRGKDIVVDGVSITAAGTAVSVYEPGVHVRNSCIQGFGRSAYGNGIWVFEEALDPDNRIFIEDNTLNHWGGYLYSAGIAIGAEDDDPRSQSQITVEVLRNRITGGATTDDIYNAAVQSFHPFIAYGNYIDTVNGAAFQNKAANSYIVCNEVVHNYGDGALYNRAAGNNVWEYNIVHDSYMGIDHFTGDGNVFRGNVIYDVAYIGRIKNDPPGSTNLLIDGNTFYNSSDWVAWIWDLTLGGSLADVVWRNNIFHSLNGGAIGEAAQNAWDEYGNDFYLTFRPRGTTGDVAGSSVAVDPRLVDPPRDFAVREPAVVMGAPWPLPCAPRAAAQKGGQP